MKTFLPPLKRFGQNFLVDKNIITKILDAVAVSEDDNVFEIGPGQGCLTFELAKKAKSVVAVEIDRGLCEHLKLIGRDYNNVDIVCSDVLKFDLKAYAKKKKIKALKVVANLPYYITTPIIEYLFKYIDLIDDIFIMVQREVAERMTACSGADAYGSLSCFVNYFSRPKALFKIKGASFFPAPKVDSCFIRLIPRREAAASLGVKSEDLFFKLMRAAFGQRRKRLYGSLSKPVGKDKLSALPCKELLESRPEKLRLEDFIRLSNLVFDFSNTR